MAIMGWNATSTTRKIYGHIFIYMCMYIYKYIFSRIWDIKYSPPQFITQVILLYPRTNRFFASPPWSEQPVISCTRPGKLLQKTNWKDPPCSWENSRVFDWAMAFWCFLMLFVCLRRPGNLRFHQLSSLGSPARVQRNILGATKKSLLKYPIPGLVN